MGEPSFCHVLPRLALDSRWQEIAPRPGPDRSARHNRRVNHRFLLTEVRAEGQNETDSSLGLSGMQGAVSTIPCMPFFVGAFAAYLPATPDDTAGIAISPTTRRTSGSARRFR